MLVYDTNKGVNLITVDALILEVDVFSSILAENFKTNIIFN